MFSRHQYVLVSICPARDTDSREPRLPDLLQCNSHPTRKQQQTQTNSKSIPSAHSRFTDGDTEAFQSLSGWVQLVKAYNSKSFQQDDPTA